MANKFSEGDKVRCINSGQFKDYLSKRALEESQLEEGQTYSVERVANRYLHFTEIDGGWCKGRFEKVEHEFEVGDRVRKISNSTTNYHSVNIGDEGEVISIEDDGVNVDWDIDYKQSVFCVHENELELISKGEDTMNNVDAIAVEIDDEATLDYLKKLARDSEFNIDVNTEGSSHGFYGFTKTGDYCVDPMSFHWVGSDSTDYLDRHGYTEIDLDNELGKLKGFLEQSEQEPPSLNGHEAEVKEGDDGSSSIDYHITVGCWEGSLVDLIEFKRRCENIGVIGTVTVETGLGKSSVDVEELFEFIEDLQDYIDNQ